ncbi:hypothetical protein [Escherichia coli]|nr:hypothetical protein [Escherichia coli]
MQTIFGCRIVRITQQRSFASENAKFAPFVALPAKERRLKKIVMMRR